MENEKPDRTGTTTDFSVTGMNCEHCVQNVQKAIQSVGGVQSATVTLEPAAASVQWSPGIQPNLEAVIAAVKQAGYEAQSRRLKCPRCQSALRPVTCDRERVEVCPQCRGEWLPAGELRKLVEHHNQVFTTEEIASLDAVNRQILTAEKDDHDELNCPCCENVRMEHFNYGDTSGIILHKCPKCRGIWTDKDQLRRIEEVVDGWKADLGKDVSRFGSVINKISVEEQKELDKAVSISRFGFVNAVLRWFCE